MTQDEILEIVKGNIKKLLTFIPSDQITMEKGLKELGANSIDRMEIMTMAMDDVGVKVPLVEFGKVKSVRDLVSVLYEKKTAS